MASGNNNRRWVIALVLALLLVIYVVFWGHHSYSSSVGPGCESLRLGPLGSAQLQVDDDEAGQTYVRNQHKGVGFEIHLATFANGGVYEETQRMMHLSAPYTGIVKSHRYGMKDLEGWREYQNLKDDISKCYKDKGVDVKDKLLWVWKPFVILKTMEKINDGDYVLYHDSSKHFKRPFFVMNGVMDLIKFLHRNGITDSVPTVRLLRRADGMDFRSDEDFKTLAKAIVGEEGVEDVNHRYRRMPMIQASFQIWRKTSRTLKILKEFQQHMLDMKLMLHANYEDQSILGFLSVKYDMPSLFKDYKDNGRGGQAVKHINFFIDALHENKVAVLYPDDPYPTCACQDDKVEYQKFGAIECLKSCPMPERIKLTPSIFRVPSAVTAFLCGDEKRNC